MKGKVIAFQKLLFSCVFIQNSRNKEIPLRGNKNKAEYIVLIILLFLEFMAFQLASFQIATSFFLIVIPAWLFHSLFLNDSIAFNLPLKSSFVIKNIFIFLSFTIIITNIVFINLMVIITGILLIPGLLMSTEPLNLSYHLSFLYEYVVALLVSLLYILIYLNGLLVAFFAKSSRLRITMMAIYTAAFMSITFVIYSILPKTDDDPILFSLPKSLNLVPNLWIYILILLCVALVVTFGGIRIATRLYDAKRRTKLV